MTEDEIMKPDDEMFDGLEKMEAQWESEYYGHLASCKGCRALITKVREHMYLEKINSLPPGDFKN